MTENPPLTRITHRDHGGGLDAARLDRSNPDNGASLAGDTDLFRPYRVADAASGQCRLGLPPTGGWGWTRLETSF